MKSDLNRQRRCG